MIKKRMYMFMVLVAYMTSCYSQPTLKGNMDIGNLGRNIQLNTLNISDNGVILVADEVGNVKSYSIQDSLYLLGEYNLNNSYVGKPILYRNKIFVPAGNNLICFDIDGSIKWTHLFSDRIKAEIKALGDRVYVHVRGEGLFCFETDNGTLIWEYKSKSGTIGGIYVSESTIVVSGLDDSLLCLRATDGQLSWKKNTNGAILSDISYDQDNVAINYCSLKDSRSFTSVLSLKTGEEVFNISLNPNCRYKPLIVKDMLYIGTEDSKIIAINYKTRDIKWEKILNDEDVLATNMVFFNGNIFFGTINRKIYKINILKGEKEILNEYEFGISELFRWDQNIYFALGNGNFMKINKN